MATPAAIAGAAGRPAVNSTAAASAVGRAVAVLPCTHQLAYGSPPVGRAGLWALHAIPADSTLAAEVTALGLLAALSPTSLGRPALDPASLRGCHVVLSVPKVSGLGGGRVLAGLESSSYYMCLGSWAQAAHPVVFNPRPLSQPGVG
jgi:hypothetical protein